MKIGSEAHKELFCHSFIESHRDFEPEKLPWPQLEGQDLEHLQRVPFWEEALNTELEAGIKIDAYLPKISDPLVHEAVNLMGIEEAQHGRLFRFLVQHYGIEVSGRSPAAPPAQIESAFIDFGYSECVDAFLGFGLFKIARQSRFLPDAMFDIFDILLQEEARHIVFFVNWIAYLQASQGRGARFWRAGHSLWHYGKAVKGVINLASNSYESKGNDFSATEASVFMDDFTVGRFLGTCLEENKRRMSRFDDRLLQPQLLPGLAQVALSGLRLFKRE